ncbi:prepilin-type N-terminal cleavage/methylation domain-containing protein [Campylobacter volucris]|uniref:type II secretion system protein n=1 Tax=Campylobacter volucris TaxID=1031542 RepID=UPI0018A1032D|nr:prepilin-type N-terminal cleavage/methylation domain-containing protein [Campylobacter volucris]MBF7042301.1 prepilin-type N-terminal cleavage/methylation domain-containing protein [Campylobacter volucris]
MKKAFTIMELVFVVIILGVLAAIALPKLGASKDEASATQALSNLKIFINDVSNYVLKNEALSSIALMSNVANIKNEDLSSLQNSSKELYFGVGNDEECFKVVFVDQESVLLLGISTKTNNNFQNIANLKNELLKKPSELNLKNQLDSALKELANTEFQSLSKSKSCQNLIHSKAFKDLASKVYILSGN